jgi:glycosyltransferase involved in cell wall biosynthesis
MKKTFKVTVSGFSHPADVQGDIQLALDRALSYDAEVEHLEDIEEEHTGPLVSVLLPNWNYAHRIGRMVDSLRAQAFKDFELIVCDDGSSDDSVKVIQGLLGPGDRLLCHGKNQGAGAAINTASRAARGRYMTWVSSDNEMTTDWLENLVGVLSSGAAVAYANYDRFNDSGPQPGTWGTPYDPNRLVNDQNCFFGPAFLMRTDVWREAGEHRGKTAHDYDHWLRVEEVCQRRGLKIAYVEKVLCHYYSGRERSTVTKRGEYDAHLWQQEARRRRGLSTAGATA